VWRHGGKALRKKTQEEADSTLISISQSFKSPNLPRMRPKSAQTTKSLRMKRVKKVRKLENEFETEQVAIKSDSQDKVSEGIQLFSQTKKDYNSLRPDGLSEKKATIQSEIRSSAFPESYIISYEVQDFQPQVSGYFREAASG
jgi:hypothetical protein